MYQMCWYTIKEILKPNKSSDFYTLTLKSKTTRRLFFYEI